MKWSPGSKLRWQAARLRKARKEAGMARTTKQLSGGGKDKFLRSIVASVADVPAGAAERVSAALTEAITDVRVRREAWGNERAAPGDAKAPQQKEKPAAVVEISPAPATAAFDAFAFSAVAVLTKKGKTALLALLGTIASVDHLRKFAEAQHLALDPAVTEAAELRAAIVAATERRIAERKAAAS
jgi:hypothetical protein